MTKIYNANDFLDKGSGIVTLCGSTCFFFEAMEADRILTFKNWIVLKCGSWGYSFHKFSNNKNLDYAQKLHKILQSDAVVVVSDKSNYIDILTKSEIKLATSLRIPVFYFDGKLFTGTTNINPYDLEDTKLIDSYINLT